MIEWNKNYSTRRIQNMTANKIIDTNIFANRKRLNKIFCFQIYNSKFTKNILSPKLIYVFVEKHYEILNE